MALALVCGITLQPLPALADSPALAADPVLKVEAERFHSLTSADVAALERIMADEVVYCHSDGKCDTKSEFLGNLRSGARKYSRIDLMNARVRHHGNIAIVNGVIAIDAEMGDRRLSDVKLAYTDVYLRERGAWRLISWHSSRVP